MHFRSSWGFLGIVMGGVLDFWDFAIHNVSHYVPNEFSTCFPSFQDVIPNNTWFLSYIVEGWEFLDFKFFCYSQHVPQAPDMFPITLHFHPMSLSKGVFL
jgi:hypothetical protein